MNTPHQIVHPLALLVVAASQIVHSAISAAAADRPNVIVVLADDLGYSDLGCYGGEIATPHIDSLAAGGVKFTQMYNSARCCPSRASLMTGVYPTQAGIGDFTTGKPSPTRGPGYLGRLNEKCCTIAEALKPAGYGCYYVGKWHMHNETGPIKRGFDEFYGYTFAHSHDQYDKDFYTRLPENRMPEISVASDDYYATDVFNDYAIEFIKQGQKSEKPWFVFLGHSSPHFPVQAPPERADKYDAIYQRGWDALRQDRYKRMTDIGLVNGDHWTFTPRSLVPVDRDDIANHFSGVPNPAWNDVAADRQQDLARRMAVFAAMVEGVDTGVGQIVEHLQSTGDLSNTLILFLSDNGACYEWGPFGFDGKSRRGETILRSGDDLRNIGGKDTHQSYGSAWANLGNTPFRLYKHFTHEGGISTPFIAHWPSRVRSAADWVREPCHVMDILPTILDATDAQYPSQLNGRDVIPVEGRSLLPLMQGETINERTIGFDHQGARALRQGDWKLVWSKRMPREIQWELYNLANDRCETNDLAAELPDKVAEMAADWDKWARRVEVIYEGTKQTEAEPKPATDSPKIANRSIRIEATVHGKELDGVVLAQGGNQHGYSLYFKAGKPMLAVRRQGQVTTLASDQQVSGKVSLVATINADVITLTVNDNDPLTIASPGLIPTQPLDALSIGFDDRTAAGNYSGPNHFTGKVINHNIQTEASTSVDRSRNRTNRQGPLPPTN